MHIVFGMTADALAHPAHPGARSGAVGRAVVGPAGMLDILAGQLGLSGPPIAPVVRIAAWEAKLESAAAIERRFYSASLSADALSTARLLLSWRDDLVEAGWTPVDAGTAGRRVADLAATELAPPPCRGAGPTSCERSARRSRAGRRRRSRQSRRSSASISCPRPGRR